MRTVIATLVLAMVSACGAAPTVVDDDRMLVVATNSIVGDLVTRVVGADASVEVLMPPGTDVHAFSPSASQVASIQSADLVVANGLGLEEGIDEVLEDATAQGVEVLELAPLANPLEAQDGEDEDHEEEGHEEDDHDHGAFDPHFWLDPTRVATAVAALADKLDIVAPGDWQERAESFTEELTSLDDRLSTGFESLEERTLVTSHDNLAYLADRYDLEIASTILKSTSTLAEPSAEDLARVVEALRELGAPAIFTDATAAGGYAEAVAGELGGQVEVVPLQTESLGAPGSGTDSYIGMMDAIGDAIIEALEG